MDGTFPRTFKGGGADLYDGDTVGVLVDKDGTSHWIIWGTGADVGGGNTSGG